MTALRSIFGHFEEERYLVRVDNDNLKQNPEDLIARVISGSNKNTKKFNYALADSLPGKCIGTALTVKNEMSGWARKKVSELNS